MSELINHEIVPRYEFRHIGYETKPVKDADGKVVEQWDHLNELSLMRQLGYTLAPPAMEEEATD